MNKNLKIIKKIKKKYYFIFNDKFLSKEISSHFDKNGLFITFLLLFLENKVNEKKIFEQIKCNLEEWLELFSKLYKSKLIIDLLEQLKLNPVIPVEQIVKSFSCFNEFITPLIKRLKENEINLNIEKTEIEKIIQCALGFILYSYIDCKLPYNLKDILVDPEYETKYLIILNNTKLFSLAKQCIIDNCGCQINDLIMLLLTNQQN